MSRSTWDVIYYATTSSTIVISHFFHGHFRHCLSLITTLSLTSRLRHIVLHYHCIAVAVATSEFHCLRLSAPSATYADLSKVVTPLASEDLRLFHCLRIYFHRQLSLLLLISAMSLLYLYVRFISEHYTPLYSGECSDIIVRVSLSLVIRHAGLDHFQ